MPNRFDFEKKFSEARHTKVSMESGRRVFLRQKWQTEPSVLEGDEYSYCVSKEPSI
jgi:hypothetical protein